MLAAAEEFVGAQALEDRGRAGEAVALFKDEIKDLERQLQEAAS